MPTIDIPNITINEVKIHEIPIWKTDVQILNNISKQYAKIFEISSKIENLSFDQKRKISLSLVRNVIYS